MSANTIPPALDIISSLPSQVVTIRQTCKKCGIAVRPKRRKRCTGCESVTYCSPRCQQADWDEHRDRCAISDPIALAVPQSDRFLQSAARKFLHRYLPHFIILAAGQFQLAIAENVARRNESVLTLTNAAYYEEWSRFSKEYALRISLIERGDSTGEGNPSSGDVRYVPRSAMLDRLDLAVGDQARRLSHIMSHENQSSRTGAIVILFAVFRRNAQFMRCSSITTSFPGVDLFRNKKIANSAEDDLVSIGLRGPNIRGSD
ncbi:hypothetical protein MPER_01149 [Moniliophthora perniciosa FA553]|nr:hypothetical protein MPER_01149 [Moniliophthora perniciosa FA553]